MENSPATPAAPSGQCHPDDLRKLNSATLAISAHTRISSVVTSKCDPNNWTPSDKHLLPSILRDDSSGFYISTYDQFRAPYFNINTGRDRDADSEIVQQLIDGQPHRIPCALDPAGVSIIPTYGPLMLPDSIDPVTAAPNYPAEVRPAQWAPDATVDEITEGIARDVLDSAALYAARIKVATGHLPDSEAIDQLKKLTIVVKNTQKIMRAASAPKRRHSPGRPRLKGLPDTIQVTTLKLEIAEKNKKFIPHKKRLATSAESTAEVQKNNSPRNCPQLQ